MIIPSPPGWCEPTEESATSRGGGAWSSASRKRSTIAFASGKPGAGVKNGGSIRYAPSTPSSDGGEGRDIVEVALPELDPLPRPFGGLLGVADEGAHRTPRVQQMTGGRAANVPGDSGDQKHREGVVQRSPLHVMSWRVRVASVCQGCAGRAVRRRSRTGRPVSVAQRARVLADGHDGMVLGIAPALARDSFCAVRSPRIVAGL